MANGKHVGICLGRFNPVHYGHVNNFLLMQKEFEENLIIIGSSNAALSMRNPFTYGERRGFIKTIFPHTKIVGIADYWDAADTWYQVLDDTIRAVFGSCKPVFIGGSIEDTSWFKSYEVINTGRFDIDVDSGFTSEMSSSFVRDILLREKNPQESLYGLVPTEIIPDLCDIFAKRYKELL